MFTTPLVYQFVGPTLTFSTILQLNITLMSVRNLSTNTATRHLLYWLNCPGARSSTPTSSITASARSDLEKEPALLGKLSNKTVH